MEGTFFLRSGPSPTSIFPLRLRRQSVQEATTALFFVQLLDELLRVLPGYRLHRELLQVLILEVLDLVFPLAVAGEPARVLAHHFLPLPLRHRVDGDLEILLDLPLPGGALVAIPAHVERSLRQGHEFHPQRAVIWTSLGLWSTDSGQRSGQGDQEARRTQDAT